MNQNRMARNCSYTNIVGSEGHHGGSVPVACPGILFGGGSKNSVEDRTERTGIWGQ